jgi:hypothetical protein
VYEEFVPQLLAQHADCKLATTTTSTTPAVSTASTGDSTQQQQTDATAEQQQADGKSKVLCEAHANCKADVHHCCDLLLWRIAL